LGAFVNTAAENLRGQGANFRDTIIKLSQAFFGTRRSQQRSVQPLKNLSILCSALQDSTDLMPTAERQTWATVTGLLSEGPNQVGNAVRDINDVVGDVQHFVADTANRSARHRTNWHR